MKALVLIFACLLLPNRQLNGCLEMDIILLLDFSGSVEGYEKFIVDALEAFSDRFQISEDRVRIGVIVFNNDPIIISGLTGNKDKIVENILKIKELRADGGTYMFPALMSAEMEFEKNPRDERKMIIFVSDGKPSDAKGYWKKTNGEIKEGNIFEFSQKIKSKGIEICGIFIDNGEPGRNFMMKISTTPYFFDSDYLSLILTLRKLDICL